MRSGDIKLTDDEPGFVQSGKRLIVEGIQDGKLVPEIWMDDFGNYGLNNPKVGVLLLGVIDIFSNKFFPDTESEINKSKIILMRSITSAFSAVGLVFIFLLLKNLYEQNVAFLGVFLVMVNPTFRSVASSLLPEVFMFCFVSVSLCCICEFFKSDRKGGSRYFLAASVFMALTISSKLYAISLYLFFLFMFFKESRKAAFLRIFLRFCTMSFLIAIVFVLTNPPFFMDFIYTIKAMTFDHMEVLQKVHAGYLGMGKEMFFVYPFVIYRDVKFGIDAISHQAPLGFKEYIVVVFAYLAVFKHVLGSIKTQKYFLLSFLGATFLWMMYPFFTLGVKVLAVKSLLLLSISVSLIVAVSVCEVLCFLKKGKNTN
nr:hypothetical protein 6 [bacterium]